MEYDFFSILTVFFPRFYDIKLLMRSIDIYQGGLSKLSEEMSVRRIGSEHQAGSDSLLTGAVFFKMLERYFEFEIDEAKYLNCIFGLDADANPTRRDLFS